MDQPSARCKRCEGWGCVVHSQTQQEKATAHADALSRQDYMEATFISMTNSVYTKVACPVCGGSGAQARH